MTGREGGWRDLLADGRGARLALICLGVWLNAADSLVTTTIMPSVARSLGGYPYFSWATAAYMVGAIFSGATAARLSARIGLRQTMILAGLVTAAGCAVSALAPDMIVLVAGRAVQGLGAGWILGACYAAIGAVFPERHLARVFGLMSAIWGVALVLGPLIGGLFGEGAQWRNLFWAFGAQALAFTAAVPALAPSTRGKAGAAAPWRQLALVLFGVFLIGAADITGSAWISAALGLASLIAFIAAVRLPEPSNASLFPRDAGRPDTLIGAGYLSFFALSASSMGFSVYAPALLQRLYDLSPLESGYAAGMESLGWTLAALMVAGWPPAWHGRAIRFGGGCIVVSLAALAVVIRLGPLWGMFVAAFVLGAGFGLTSGFASRRLIAAAAEDERELASAGINSMRLVGNAAGACFSGVIANLLGLAAGVTLEAAQASSVWLFALATPVALVGAAAVWKVGGDRVAEA